MFKVHGELHPVCRSLGARIFTSSTAWVRVAWLPDISIGLFHEATGRAHDSGWFGVYRQQIRAGPRTTPYFCDCYCWHIVLPEYLAQIQASWTDDSVERPKMIFDQFPKAARDGFRPRLFVEEIDKVKEGSEWANNILFTLFNAVDKHKGQLVFDSNLSKQQFLNRFGEPIARRVKENCNVREWGFQ